MARRKKHTRLPNGYGTIRYLGKNRRNPYAVHPPGKIDDNGNTVYEKAICYVDDWYKGFMVLNAWHAGTYKAGMELDINTCDRNSADDYINRILADYSVTRGEYGKQMTFEEVYHQFFDWKYNQANGKSYSESSKNCTKAAFKNCSAIHDKAFSSLRYKDLQDVIDKCPKKHSSKELIVSLMHQMYAYADIYEIVDKDYSAHVKINSEDDDEHGIPFSDNDLQILWSNKRDDIVQSLLIMCYSGFRITEYKTLSIHIREKYFQGGIKTDSGKNRIVPIHSGIFDIVKYRNNKYGCLLPESVAMYRKKMYETLERLGIPKHTPHDCRHTFSMLCEKYKVSEADRKRMLGHSFGNDITNGIYGHRSIDDLRSEIEKIKIYL